MNERNSTFNINGIRKTILTTAGCVLIVTVLASSAYLVQLLRTQQSEVESLFQQIKEQETRITVLVPSVEALKKSLEETKAQVIVQKEDLAEAGRAIKALETAHAQLEEDTQKIKDGEKEWMKESLISLGNLEAKIDEAATKTVSLESGAMDSNKEITLLKEQVSALKALLNKIVEALPPSSPAKERIQETLHPELLK